ncbi:MULTISPECIES: hypothetical protein [unclassified Beijerinckia]|uniref:hypothetical protein n=1 Tax=unclassified Beijerinckia TaxID=2638183 RepID=UPI00089A3082|nr:MULTISPECIES: hypothetical protein [unclassified Beijerinckia]MDH7794141.1 hypothetical protein [Beijerinckia sp. GAS462]SEB54200.1 hypothetical protein SAMN05443249_0406 [Beijerinckia sp. 28-YEA-48]
MSDPQSELRAIEKLKNAADCGLPVSFTPEEAEILQRFARTLMGFEALGRVAKLLRAILTYIGWAFAAYLAFKSGLFGWIRSGL